MELTAAAREPGMKATANEVITEVMAKAKAGGGTGGYMRPAMQKWNTMGQLPIQLGFTTEQLASAGVNALTEQAELGNLLCVHHKQQLAPDTVYPKTACPALNKTDRIDSAKCADVIQADEYPLMVQLAKAAVTNATPSAPATPPKASKATASKHKAKKAAADASASITVEDDGDDASADEAVAAVTVKKRGAPKKTAISKAAKPSPKPKAPKAARQTRKAVAPRAARTSKAVPPPIVVEVDEEEAEAEAAEADSDSNASGDASEDDDEYGSASSESSEEEDD